MQYVKIIFSVGGMRVTSERCTSETAFSYIAPHFLIRLADSLKESDSIATFKSKLETLFVQAFDLSNRSVNEGYRL